MGKMIEIVSLRNIETPTGFMYGVSVPDLNSSGTPMRKKFKPQGTADYYVGVTSFSGAFLWDGKPVEVSHTH